MQAGPIAPMETQGKKHLGHWWRHAIFALALVCLGSAARGQMFSRALQEAWSGQDLAETHDHPVIETAGHVSNQSSDSQVFWWDSFGKVRFNRNDPDSPLIEYRLLTIGAGTEGSSIKATMDEIDAALGFHVGKLGDWDVAAMLGAGFSSTHPFVNSTGVFGIGHLTAEQAIDRQNSLLVSVDYQGNSGLLPDIPLPGFAWIHRSKSFDALMGYPLSRIRWQMTQRLVFALQYNVPYSADADLEYRITRHLGLYANAANFCQGFVLASGDITNRQFYQMRRVEAGVRFIRQPLIDASIGVGYAFDQEFSSGYDVQNLQPIGQISNEPYLALVVRGTF